MAGLLSFLAGLNQAGLAADTGRMQGQAVKRKDERQTMLDQLAQERQAAQDAQEAERSTLLNQLTQAQIGKMNAPPVPVAPEMTYDRERGGYVSPEGFKPVPGLPQIPRATTPQTPVRGTPEYNAMLEAEARARAAGGGGERGAQLPAPAIEKMIDLDDLIAQSNRASRSLGAAVASGKNVTGRAFGFIPLPNAARDIFKQGGDEGVSARSDLSNIASSIMKLRSGAAVSDAEFARLEPFLPSNNDDEALAMIKLRKLREALEDLKRIRLENYQRYGKRGLEQPRGEDPETGVDLDDAIAGEIARASGRRP